MAESIHKFGERAHQLLGYFHVWRALLPDLPKHTQADTAVPATFRWGDFALWYLAAHGALVEPWALESHTRHFLHINADHSLSWQDWQKLARPELTHTQEIQKLKNWRWDQKGYLFPQVVVFLKLIGQ